MKIKLIIPCTKNCCPGVRLVAVIWKCNGPGYGFFRQTGYIPVAVVCRWPENTSSGSVDRRANTLNCWTRYLNEGRAWGTYSQHFSIKWYLQPTPSKLTGHSGNGFSFCNRYWWLVWWHTLLVYFFTAECGYKDTYGAMPSYVKRVQPFIVQR